MNFGDVGWLAIEDVDIFHQDDSGFSCTEITNIGHVGRLPIEDMDIFCQNVSIFVHLNNEFWVCWTVSY